MKSSSETTNYVTASMLYNYMECEHLVWRDVHGPQEEKITETNPFVELLWEKGVNHEREVVSQLGEFTDLSEGTMLERIEKTKSEIESATPLIYQGMLVHENLLGIPDILQLQDDGTYIPVEIKSGRGLADDDSDTATPGGLKKTYAVQLALYYELLKNLGYATDKKGLIIDISGEIIEYDLSQTIGVRDKRSYWDLYIETKEAVQSLISNNSSNLPAAISKCKLCSWHDSCRTWIEESDDLTGLFYVGRSKRDVIYSDLGLSRIDDMLEIDTDELLSKKKTDKSFLKGIGASTLDKIVRRARIMKITRNPVLYNKILFPKVEVELFFDIEDDPTQDYVYMHGVYERKSGNARFLNFTATEISPQAEKSAWSQFWDYIGTLPSDNYSVYYFSAHEKTMYRLLQRKYPDVITSEQLEYFFESPNSIDLYKIILRDTDWPLGSYSLKALATSLGFNWRDESPSGALSIQWFNEFVETGNQEMLDRILLYNEDDCKATMVLKDKLKEMSDLL